MSYSQFINGLKKSQIEMNRKMLADIAVNDFEQFGHLVNEAKAALGQEKVEVKPVAKKVVVKAAFKKVPAKKVELKEVKPKQVKQSSKVEKIVKEIAKVEEIKK